MESKSVLSKEELILISSFFKDFRKDIFRYLMKNVRHVESVEDLTSRVYFKAAKAVMAGKYKERGNRKAWLMKIAHNEMISYFRLKKISTLSILSDDQVNEVKSKSLSPEDIFINSEVHERLRVLIGCLPEKEKQVIHLRVYEGLSFKEIYALTGENSNTTRVRYHKAVINLRKLVEADESLKASS